MKNSISILSFIFFSYIVFSQEKFKIVSTESNDSIGHFYLQKKNDKKKKKLNMDLYLFSPFDSKYRHFAVLIRKDWEGWSAIDFDENKLFTVYNLAHGEPIPDKLVENKIRIVDNNKIGFANNFGKIIIQPQFEMVSHFHKGKAIIAEDCSKIPWDSESHKGACEHYSIECKKHGYINNKGEIIKLGDYSFDEIQKEIKWKSKNL